MKRLSVVLAAGLFFPVFCFSQTQTGNASYNESKSGITVSHSSLSFNTRVRITNLGNNRSVEATVNGRIPISSGRIADISREAGDALEMSKTGMTRVRLEVLPFVHTGAAAAPAEENPAPASAPRPPPAAAAADPPAAAAVREPDSPAAPAAGIQYSEVPAIYPVQPCCNKYLMLALLFLLLVIIALLIVIAARRQRSIIFPVEPWRFPPWYRRYLLCVKKYRNAARRRGK
jgi:hypothetical protein